MVEGAGEAAKSRRWRKGPDGREELFNAPRGASREVVLHSRHEALEGRTACQVRQ